MTPDRLLLLVASALGRRPLPLEVSAWAQVLEHTRDDDAEQGLALHRASSPHPPTAADVRRLAIGVANRRADDALNDRLRIERETGRVHDPADPERHGKPLVPMPDHVREARRALDRAVATRTAELQEEPA